MSQSRYDNYCDIMDRANKYLNLNLGKFYLYPEDGMNPIVIGGFEALNSCFKEEEFIRISFSESTTQEYTLFYDNHSHHK